MARRARREPRRGKGGEGAAAPAGRPGRSRWLRVLAWVSGLVLAAVLVERWTRPVEEPSAATSIPAPSFAPSDPSSDAAREPPSSAAAIEELIADGKRLADRLVEAFPEDPRALTLGAQIQFALGNSTQAVAWWERSVKLDPRYAEAWGGLAESHWERGDFEQAVRCMQHVRETNPQLADERIYVQVDSLLNLDRTQEAIALLDSRTQASALSAPGRVVLGRACLQAESYARARREFEAAIAVQPQLASAHYGLAEALTGLGETDAAQQHRDEYARLKQADLAAWDRQRGTGRGLEKVNPAEVRGLIAGFYFRAGEVYMAHGKLPPAETLGREAQGPAQK
jgi:tetratricopeptide (TPR) repeat protein